jgi:ribosomal protein L11 methyltransferase
MTEKTTPAEWVAVEVALPAEMADALSDFCVEHGSRGVVVDDADSLHVSVTAYFPSEQWSGIESELDRLLAHLSDLFPNLSQPKIRTSVLPNENWAAAWRENFTAVQVGAKLIVTPPWIQPQASGRHVIVIEPGEAFGTGTHETTQGCMELLERVMEELASLSEPPSVLDLGCGSGILAISAAKLGAMEVTAVDNDPVAIDSARKNVELNHVERTVVLVCQSIQDTVRRSDIVVANLDPMALMRFRDTLIELANRYLIISGVPLDQWDLIRQLFETGPSRLVKEIKKAEWGSGLYATVDVKSTGISR